MRIEGREEVKEKGSEYLLGLFGRGSDRPFCLRARGSHWLVVWAAIRSTIRSDDRDERAGVLGSSSLRLRHVVRVEHRVCHVG